MTTKPLTNIRTFITVILKSGEVVRCPCGEKMGDAMVSGETWYTCTNRRCRQKLKVIVEE